MRPQSALAKLLVAQWNKPGVADVWWKCCWSLEWISRKEDQGLLQLFPVKRKRQPYRHNWKPSRRPKRRSRKDHPGGVLFPLPDNPGSSRLPPSIH